MIIMTVTYVSNMFPILKVASPNTFVASQQDGESFTNDKR